MEEKSNIILIGFMGTGKTAIGRRLANILKMKFYDTDHEIEKVTEMSIAMLFKKHGEIRFRSEEELMVKKLLHKKNVIIATGGGMVLNPKNIELLSKTGVLICLTARPEVIYERVRRRNNRPLLQKGNTYDTIVKLLKEREDFYKCSDFTVDTSDKSFDEIIEQILSYTNKKNIVNN